MTPYSWFGGAVFDTFVALELWGEREFVFELYENSWIKIYHMMMGWMDGCIAMDGNNEALFFGRKVVFGR